MDHHVYHICNIVAYMIYMVHKVYEILLYIIISFKAPCIIYATSLYLLKYLLDGDKMVHSQGFGPKIDNIIPQTERNMVKSTFCP